MELGSDKVIQKVKQAEPPISEYLVDQRINRPSEDESFHFNRKLLSDLYQICMQTAEHYLNVDVIPHGFLFQSQRFADSLTPDMAQTYIDTVDLHLDDIFRKYAFTVAKHVKTERWWASFLLHDLEKFIQSTNRQCAHLLGERLGHVSYVRLGRVYAWARERVALETDDEQTQLTQLLRTRLRRRLSRLFWLSRAGKRRAHSHPLLTSLRHELLRVRTRATGNLLREEALPGKEQQTSWTTDRASLAKLDENGHSRLKQIVPTSLFPAFEKLIEKMTDAFLELPPHVPGVPLHNNSHSHKRDYWRELLACTVVGFYNHLNDTATDVDADEIMEDATLRTDAASGVAHEADSLDSDSGAQVLEPCVRKACRRLNPAVVQAALDRFDHCSRPNRKRSLPSSIPVYEEDRIASELVTQKAAAPTVVSVTETADEQLLDALRRSKCQTFVNSISTVVQSGTVAEQGKHCDTTHGTDATAPVLPLTPKGTKWDTKDTTPSTAETHATTPSKRRSHRSLRTRPSRTPSENSFSEGEVLSDTEEERVDSTGELEDHVADLGERTNADIEDEEAEELIRMVNSQLGHTTPSSDIDLTELEIMDEWAPPTSSMIAGSRTGIECSGEEEVAAEVEVTVTAQCVSVEEINQKLDHILTEMVSVYEAEMDNLVVNKGLVPSMGEDAARFTHSTSAVQVSTEIDASIERTASAFKEHVTSVLANLLHAVPMLVDTNGTLKRGFVASSAKSSASRVITGQRGSRLLSMLKAYQQDVVHKKQNTAVN